MSLVIRIPNVLPIMQPHMADELAVQSICRKQSYTLRKPHVPSTPSLPIQNMRPSHQCILVVVPAKDLALSTFDSCPGHTLDCVDV